MKKNCLDNDVKNIFESLYSSDLNDTVVAHFDNPTKESFRKFDSELKIVFNILRKFRNSMLFMLPAKQRWTARKHYKNFDENNRAETKKSELKQDKEVVVEQPQKETNTEIIPKDA